MKKNLTVKCSWTFASRRTNSGKQRSWVFFAQNVGEEKPVSLLLRACLSCSISVCKSDRCFCMSVLTLSRVLFWRCRLDMVYLVSMARKGREHRPLSTPKLLLGEKPTAKWNGIRRNRREIPHLLLCFRMLLLCYVCSNRGFSMYNIGRPLVNARFDCEAQRKRLNNIRVAHVVLQKQKHYSVTYDRTLVDREVLGNAGTYPKKEYKMRKKRFQGKNLFQQ